MDTLGQRIRKLRKERQLTLEALAGDTLTKGMLSLIENNKANPSMDSLTYIAKRLEIEVAELLEEVPTEELQAVLAKAEKLYYTDVDQITDEHTQLITLIEAYLPKLTQGYEAARLLDMYSRVLHFQQQEGWKAPLQQAASMYEQMKALERRASLGIFLAITYMEAFNYEKALVILREERRQWKLQSTYRSPLVQLDFNYIEAILRFAVGDYDEALKITEDSFEFSKKEGVFYQIDHLYSLAVSYALFSNDEKRRLYYVKKLKLYAELTEDERVWKFLRYVDVYLLNAEKQDYEKAIDYLEKHRKAYRLGEIDKMYYYLEKGKALLGLEKYQQAIALFKKIHILTYINHPFDLIYLHGKDAYLAICYQAIGQQEEAFQHASKAYENVLPLPSLPHRQLIIDTFEQLKKSGQQS